MRRKSLRSRFISYISLAAISTACLAVYSFFVIRDMAGRLGEAGGRIELNYLIFLIVFWIVFFIVAVFALRNMSRMEDTIKMVSTQALRMSQGKSITRSTNKENNELGDLAYAINALLEYILGRVKILERINNGDYSFDIEPLGDTDKLTLAIINVVNTNNEILYEIKKTAHGLSEIANRISNGADALSSGTTEQAATIEEFSAVMAEVQSMADKTADISKDTRDTALQASGVIESSVADIRRMTDAMDSITEASHRIETVIKFIDEIAFQTNILALNAAIEAARAGAHGKGFAVVAEEVRELASKSAAAAKETSELIQMSIQSVYEGNEIVRQTADSVDSLGMNATSAASNMDLLADSSENQRMSISDINRGINQISHVIQANSITAQENSLSAQSMAVQSQQLQMLVDRFKLRGN